MVKNKAPDLGELNLDSQESEEYIEKTAYKTSEVNIEETIEHGTIKITPELAKQASHAVRERIEKTADYTKERIDRINLNYQIYYQKKSDTNSLSQVIYPATYNVVEDWVDDLFLIFEKLADTVEVEAKGDVLEEFITKTLPQSTSEYDKASGKLLSLAKQLFGEVNIKSNSVYYFQKRDIIKATLKEYIRRSGYSNVLEKFLTGGVVSGMFVFKEGWGTDEKYQIKVNQITDDKEYIKTGKFKYEVIKDSKYTLKAVDPRKLIFRKDCIDWMIEFDTIRFSEILNMTLENGKSKKNAIYDFNYVAKVTDFLKEDVKFPTFEEEADYNGLDSDEINMDDIVKIDGDVTVYEGHHIPLVIGGKNIKALITCIKIGDGNYFPIRIQETPFVLGIPYHVENFIKKTGDVGGMGAPEVIEKLQEILNSFMAFSVDMVDMSIWGVGMGDKEAIVDPSKLERMKPRMFVQLKNMKGRSIRDVIDWVRPPVDALNSMQMIFGMILQILNKTSRKGPSGEKIAPNPSATEATNIIQELQKSVNRVGIRLNSSFVEIIKRMYIYTLMNRDSSLNVKADSYILKDGYTKENLGNMVDKVNKEVELTPQEILVDGVDFNVRAIDLDQNKQAVEKQQAMQLVELLYKTVGITQQTQSTDPMTGKPVTSTSPKVFKDDSGAEVVIDEYKMVQSIISKVSGLDNIFKRVDNKEPIEQKANETPQSSASPLTASPDNGDILGGAMQLG